MHFCDKSEKKETRLKALLLLEFKWCHVSESNQGHRDFQSLALPTELTRVITKVIT